MTRPPPFRAEHIGSLLRPPELLRAREQHAAGELDRNGLAAIENAAIARVVKLQEDVGLRVVTDGEFRRGTYSDAFTSGGARLDQVAKPRPSDGAAHSNGCRPHRLEGTTERRRLSLSQVADHAHAQDYAPGPLLHSLSRGARQYQPRCLSRPRRLLVRPGRSLRPRNALARGRRMPLSADRRNVAGEARRSACASIAGGARR